MRTGAALKARGRRVLLGALLAAALVPALLPVVGYRPLVVRSGSMAPALLTGDAIVTQRIAPSSVRVGDIVTFSDPSRANALVTHRVTSVGRQGATFSFVTKGDVNTGVEEWTSAEGGEIGRLAVRLPKFGFLVAALSTSVARGALVGLFLALSMIAALRRIWS